MRDDMALQHRVPQAVVINIFQNHLRSSQNVTSVHLMASSTSRCPVLISRISANEVLTIPTDHNSH